MSRRACLLCPCRRKAQAYVPTLTDPAAVAATFWGYLSENCSPNEMQTAQERLKKLAIWSTKQKDENTGRANDRFTTSRLAAWKLATLEHGQWLDDVEAQPTCQYGGAACNASSCYPQRQLAYGKVFRADLQPRGVRQIMRQVCESHGCRSRCLGLVCRQTP